MASAGMDSTGTISSSVAKVPCNPDRMACSRLPNAIPLRSRWPLHRAPSAIRRSNEARSIVPDLIPRVVSRADQISPALLASGGRDSRRRHQSWQFEFVTLPVRRKNPIVWHGRFVDVRHSACLPRKGYAVSKFVEPCRILNSVRAVCARRTDSERGLAGLGMPLQLPGRPVSALPAADRATVFAASVGKSAARQTPVPQ